MMKTNNLTASLIGSVVVAVFMAAACGGSDSIAPSKSDPPAFTKAFVQQAIDRYDEEGRDATIAYYNTMESVDGGWYIFITVERTNRLVSHAVSPELVGTKSQNILGPDGYPVGLQGLLVATQDGGWHDYTWENPDTGQVETKHSWMVRYDGLIFGSGWYEPGPSKSDPAAFTRAFVQRATTLYDAVGRSGTVSYYNSTESVDDEWYVFIIDESDVIIGHATVPDNIGQSIRGPLGVDSTGYAFGAVMADATEEGNWVSYVYLNPVTGEEGTKHSWVVEHDGLVFGSGWYEPTN